MNYSIIFTEISFSPETSILHTNSPWVCVNKFCSNDGATYIIGEIIAKDTLNVKVKYLNPHSVMLL